MESAVSSSMSNTALILRTTFGNSNLTPDEALLAYFLFLMTFMQRVESNK